MAKASIFVYGTLKRDQLRGRMWPRPAQSVAPAVVRAQLFDFGSYPGIVAGQDWVLGELWSIQERDLAETFRVLDAIEGYDPRQHRGLYLRTEILAFPEDDGNDCHFIDPMEPILASTYVAKDPSLLIRARRIEPYQTWNGLLVAQWPDSLTRIPTSLDDE